MVTLLAPRVWQEITEEAARCKKPAHVAVAYFGTRGDSLLPLPEGSSLVVDASLPTLAAGSTNPMALKRLSLRGVNIYSVQYLHAKVYAFDDAAFVGSANVSDRSDSTLIEAMFRSSSRATIASVRAFVESISFTKLSSHDLADLSKFYQAPKPRSNSVDPNQIKYSTLLMELLMEQGAGRETQVQPPKAVWENYFGIKYGQHILPTLSLINESDNLAVQTQRGVVKHDHNYTIEIAGAELPRPAILQMRRVGKDTYSYRVHRPRDATYANVNTLLETMRNPLRRSGRMWTLI